MTEDDILTVADVCKELRCSKAHVHNTINGKVRGVTALPAIRMGRRKLVRRSALEAWKKDNESIAVSDMIPASEISADRPTKGVS